MVDGGDLDRFPPPPTLSLPAHAAEDDGSAGPTPPPLPPMLFNDEIAKLFYSRINNYQFF
jgi:hypothetical protein